MDAALAAFLEQHECVSEEIVVWVAALQLRVRTYVTRVTPPCEWISSIRALVFQHQNVLVIHDADNNVHLTPGGRRETDETLEEALHRELLEESGWTVHPPMVLGVVAYHHLTAKPAGYAYPYPDFLHLIYCAEADQYQPAARENNGYERSAQFHAIADARALVQSPTQQALLTAALQRR